MINLRLSINVCCQHKKKKKEKYIIDFQPHQCQCRLLECSRIQTLTDVGFPFHPTPAVYCRFHAHFLSSVGLFLGCGFSEKLNMIFRGSIHPHVGSCIHTMDTDKCMNQCVSVSGMSVTWIIICELEWCLVKQWAVRHRDKLCTLLLVPSGTTGRVSTILCVCVCGACLYAFVFMYILQISLHLQALICISMFTDLHR